MKEIKLPSGAILKITVSPFADSKALYQAIMEELKSIDFKGSADFAKIFKDIACVGFSSRKIELCLEQCFKRCIYNCGKGDLKIDKDTFEPPENREDYISVCIEVAKENISPFMKSLYVEFKQAMQIMPEVPA